MIHAMFSPVSAPASPVSGDHAGYATIALSAHRSAQGPILHRYRDGRVQIDSGNGTLTGRPLTTDQFRPAARAAVNWLPLFAGMH